MGYTNRELMLLAYMKQHSGGLVVAAETNTAVNGYQVPVLSTEQVHAIYNAIISGKSVSIIDATEMMAFQGINTDVISEEIFVSFRYFDKMILEYSENGDITYKALA